MTTKERFDHLCKKYHYDSEAVKDKLDFIQSLKHVEGEWAGKPIKLHPWQINDIIKPVFGLKTKKGGPRLIKKVYIEIPKKNGKTTLLAAILCTLLFTDNEGGAQIYNCAGDDTQSNLLFRIAKHMVLNDEELKGMSLQYQSQIDFKDRFIRKITSKAETKHGFNSHAVAYDEFAYAGKTDLFDALWRSGAMRTQFLFFMITTAGDDKNSIAYNQHLYLERAMEGIIEDDSYWGVIYTSKGEWDKESTMKEANPMWEYSKTFRDNLRLEAKEAQNDVSKENSFKNLRLNIWTSSTVKWLNDEQWMEGSAEPEIDSPYYMGLDLSSKMDITALCLLHASTFKNVLLYYWIPEKAATFYEKKYNIPFRRWSRGNLTIVEGNVIDFDLVEQKIEEVMKVYGYPKKLGFDPWNSIQLGTRLQKIHGIEAEMMRQGFGLSVGNKGIAEATEEGTFRHGGDPVLRWMIDNVEIRTNENQDIKIVKPDSEQKVDGVVSMSMAFNLWLADDVQRESVYEHRGIRTV